MIDIQKLRAWWANKQGLDSSPKELSAAEVLSKTGWARSVGGAGPYITLFARSGIGRAAVDEAVARCEIHELPAARGCTYVVGAEDFALALRASAGFGEAAAINSAKKYCAVTDKEIDRLSDGILDVLEKNVLEPRELKDALGDKVRNLGDAGKKRGITTTLPLALGKLQAEGWIRRVPTNGRLDQQRYRYTVWKQNPLKHCKWPDEEVHARLAERYFRWIGPASAAHFQCFSGLGVKAAKAAMDACGLVPLKSADERMLFKEDREAFLKFKPPAKPAFKLVSCLDGILLLRRDAMSLVDPADAKREVMGDDGQRALGGLADLPSNAILDRGQVIGLWEFDPAEGKIVWACFRKPPAGMSDEVARMEKFIRDELGDARSFSLDSPQSRRPRVEGLRKGF